MSLEYKPAVEPLPISPLLDARCTPDISTPPLVPSGRGNPWSHFRLILWGVGEKCPFGSLRGPEKALPTETKFGSGIPICRPHGFREVQAPIPTWLPSLGERGTQLDHMPLYSRQAVLGVEPPSLSISLSPSSCLAAVAPTGVCTGVPRS